MYIKIDVQLQSPMMVGGKTLTSNFKESKPYIPGGVLRAAFATAIIQRCPYEHKNNWLQYRDEYECADCKYSALCHDFSQIIFPTLYPLEGRAFPRTARKEKYGLDEPKVFDILRSRLANEGKNKEECNWERQEGIHKDGKKVDVVHTLITRTAIDSNRRCAKNEALYSYYAVDRRMIDERGALVEAVFSGGISLSQEQFDSLENIRELHIGSGVTRGMGAGSVAYAKTSFWDTPKLLRERILKFSEGLPGDDLYVILDFMTDTYLALENLADDDKSVADVDNSQFLKYLEMAVGLPAVYMLEKVFKEQEVYRGFNTAVPAEDKMRRKGRLIVKAGAVFVYRVSPVAFNEHRLFELEMSGIGDNVCHGFGRICICDPFHIKFDVLQGEGVHE